MPNSLRIGLACVCALVAGFGGREPTVAAQRLPADTKRADNRLSVGQVIVVETSKGTFSFETYPVDAPQTVAHIVELVRQGFYDGQRFHRAIPGFLIQWGDPQSRDAGKRADWGKGSAASSGKAIGVAEVARRRLHTTGAVGVASPTGHPQLADSQIYVTLAPRPDLDGHYTVFGRLVDGDNVPLRIEDGDLIHRMYVKQ